MIKAVIWDMDGVLIDSEYIHAEIESEVFANFGIHLKPKEITRKYAGSKIEDEFKDVIKNSGKKLDLQLLIDLRNDLIKKEFIDKVKGTPHIVDVLKQLGKKYPQAVATSSEENFAKIVLEKNGILQYMKATLYGNMVKHSKPNPEIFLMAAKSLKVDPQNCIVIEDSQNGFKAAKAAGTLLIARKADHNKKLDFSTADYVVTDLREIPNIIQSINSKGENG